MEIFSTYAYAGLYDDRLSFSRMQVEKVKKFIEKALKDENVIESMYFCYVYNVNQLLELHLIDGDMISKANNAFLENIQNTDIVTIYMHMSILGQGMTDDMKNEAKEKIKKRIAECEAKPGIIGYGISNGILYYDTQSIDMGMHLKQYWN